MKLILKILFIFLGIFSLVLWLLMLLYLIDVNINIKDFNLKETIYPIIDRLSSSTRDLNGLSQVGSFFNILTSLTSVFIVWLVATGVYYQKKELDSLKIQVKEQMEQNKEEEKINRTLKEIENWLSVKRNVEENRFDRRSIKNLCNTIEGIRSIETHGLNKFIDLRLLMNIVGEQSTRELLGDMERNLDDELQASLDDELLQTQIDNYEDAIAMGEGGSVRGGADVIRVYESRLLYERVRENISFINEF